jgi:hypothetical protein
MDEGKINKWVQELIVRRGFMRRLKYIPNGFYKELTEDEQREVMKRYRDRIREAPPFETK